MSKFNHTLLNSDKTADQLRGMEMAVKSKTFSLLPEVLKLISSKDQEVHKQAGESAIELAKICLRSKGSTSLDPVTSIATQVIRSLDPEYITALHKQLHSLDTAQTIEALMLLKFFIDEKQAEEILLHSLKNPNGKIRATAALHIGLTASKRNAEVLTKFLEDSDNRVKANTIEVFEKLKKKVFIRILNRFREDANNRIRANALKAMYTLGETDIENDLQFMLMDPKALMRASSVWVIGEIGKTSPHTLELLDIVKNDPDKMVRRNLLLVLSKLGNVPEVEFLRAALDKDLQNLLKNQIIKKKDLHIEQNPTEAYYEIKLNGIITARTVLALKLLLDELIHSESRFVFEMSKVEYVDSSAVGLIINFNKSLLKQNGFLFMYGCNYRVSSLFQVAGIDKVLHIFNSLQEIHEFLALSDNEGAN